MSEELQKVLAYEKHLLEEREKLCQLVAESEDDSKLIRAKLDYFQKEINYMTQQVELLKDELIRTEIKTESEVVVVDDMPQVEIQQELTTHKTVEQEAATQEIPKPAMIQFSDTKEEEQWKQSSAPEKKDLEKTIGKSLMGVFASVLVFISLILFATAILPLFSDGAKMFTTYVVSFGFLGIGLFKWKKNKENKFYMALTACGVGALYISLLLSNMYFDAIGDIPLYILIALWGLGVCFLCRIQNTLFQIIGHMGIFISVAFGCFLCLKTDDAMKFTVLLVYYLATMVMFFAVNPERKIAKNAIFHFFNLLNCVVVVPSAYGILGAGASFPMVLLLAILGVNIGVMLWSEADAQGVDFAIFSNVFLVLFWVILGRLLADVPEETCGVCMYFVAMLLFFAVEGKGFVKNAGKYITQACLLFMAVNALGNNIICAEYLYVPLLVVPMVLVGYFRGNVFGKYISQLLLFVYVFQEMDHTEMHFLLALCAVILMYAFMYIKTE